MMTAPDGSSSPDDSIARAYQPQRLRGAVIGVAWNLLWLGGALAMGLEMRALEMFGSGGGWQTGLAGGAVYLVGFFALYAALNFPLDLWYGYLHERQFGLVKQGLRAWGRDWMRGLVHHGLMFVAGSMLILLLQRLLGEFWVIGLALPLLGIFVGSTWLAVDLLPPGLFDFEKPDPALMARLRRLAGPLDPGPVILFSHPEQRDFSGGLLGLGRRQILLLSRPTVQLCSDRTLRFILLHEMGHRRGHHLLISAVAGWAIAVAGLGASGLLIGRRAEGVLGTAAFIPWLALTFTAFMVLMHPALAYLGRRLEYRADRYYLNHAGSAAEMAEALDELSRRDLARMDLSRRRQSLVQALPIPSRRLKAARRLEGTSSLNKAVGG